MTATDDNALKQVGRRSDSFVHRLADGKSLWLIKTYTHAKERDRQGNLRFELNENKEPISGVSKRDLVRDNRAISSSRKNISYMFFHRTAGNAIGKFQDS